MTELKKIIDKRFIIQGWRFLGRKCKKLVLHSVSFCGEEKVTKNLLYRKECNELLVNRYLILGIMVPPQLLVTAIENVTKP